MVPRTNWRRLPEKLGLLKGGGPKNTTHPVLRPVLGYSRGSKPVSPLRRRTGGRASAAPTGFRWPVSVLRGLRRSWNSHSRLQVERRKPAPKPARASGVQVPDALFAPYPRDRRRWSASKFELVQRTHLRRQTPGRIYDAVAGRAPQRAEELRARAVVGRVVSRAASPIKVTHSA